LTGHGSPLFSVVIATLDRAEMLARSLDSVLSQDFSDVEVIVVDGGSTDGTAALLAGLGSKVRTIQERGGGPGGARNLGVAEARGRFVVFVDSDDVLLPGALARYAAVIAEVTDAKILWLLRQLCE
jgi:glycosyltransferase involved in cell wall biosynthesis